MSRSFRKFALAVAGLAFSSLLSAQGAGGEGYTPPSTSELYDVKEPLVPAYVRVKKVKSHFYLGLGGSFGTSRLDAGDGTPNASWNIVAEGGYVKALSSFTRVDVGLEFLNGQIGNSLNKLHIGLGAMAKVGYGYNISENLYALLRFGYGLASASYSGPLGASKTILGTVWQLGFQLIVPTDTSLDVLGGIFASQYGFADQGTYNVYEGRIGLRIRV